MTILLARVGLREARCACSAWSAAGEIGSAAAPSGAAPLAAAAQVYSSPNAPPPVLYSALTVVADSQGGTTCTPVSTTTGAAASKGGLSDTDLNVQYGAAPGLRAAESACGPTVRLKPSLRAMPPGSSTYMCKLTQMARTHTSMHHVRSHVSRQYVRTLVVCEAVHGLQLRRRCPYASHQRGRCAP